MRGNELEERRKENLTKTCLAGHKDEILTSESRCYQLPGGQGPWYYSRRNKEARWIGRPMIKAGAEILGWLLPLGAGVVGVVVTGVGAAGVEEGAFARTVGSGGSFTLEFVRTGRGGSAGGRAILGMSSKRDPGWTGVM